MTSKSPVSHIDEHGRKLILTDPVTGQHINYHEMVFGHVIEPGTYFDTYYKIAMIKVRPAGALTTMFVDASYLHFKWEFV